MAAPTEIRNLVERFEQHAESYRSGNYNEAQLRKEFVDPMFKALGWDMDNLSSYAEAYKDLIHEDAIKIGGAMMSFFYKERAVKSARTIFPKVVIKNLREFPYPSSIPGSVAERLLGFANQALALRGQFAVAKTSHASTNIQRQIDATDAQIDNLVYELYGLNDKEIKIVEVAI